MKPQKVYSVKANTHISSTRNHRLVRAACAKGLTNVTVTWYPKYTGTCLSPQRGWFLKADQLPEKHIGFEVAEAEARINQIQAIKN